MELKMVPLAKSLKLFKRSAPAGKTKSSPATGATLPTQLVVVCQKLLKRLCPFHTRVAPRPSFCHPSQVQKTKMVKRILGLIVVDWLLVAKKYWKIKNIWRVTGS